MSFLKDLGTLFSSNKSTNSSQPQLQVTFLLNVLDIVLSPNDDYYNSPADIGKIRCKPVQSAIRKKDDELQYFAYPADRRNVTYPLPGEQVYAYVGLSDFTNEAGKPVPVLYYTNNITQNNSITINSLPNLGDQTLQTNDPPGFFQAIADKFTSKLRNINSYKTSTNLVRERAPLRPYEGDIIMQGRFGQSIRFGSTTGDKDSPWSKNGTSGNPLSILRVHNAISNNPTTVEDVNNDNSSLYLCSTQKIEMRLGCSTKMNSWRTIYKLNPGTSDAVQGSNASSNKDETQVYQKVIDVQLPVSKSFETTT